MHILTPASEFIIRQSLHSFMTGKTSSLRFYTNADKTVEVFKLEKCDRCGGEARGPNSIIFDKVPNPHLFVKAGVQPSTVTAELSATEEGDCDCDDCRK